MEAARLPAPSGHYAHCTTTSAPGSKWAQLRTELVADTAAREEVNLAQGRLQRRRGGVAAKPMRRAEGGATQADACEDAATRCSLAAAATSHRSARIDPTLARRRSLLSETAAMDDGAERVVPTAMGTVRRRRSEFVAPTALAQSERLSEASEFVAPAALPLC